MSRSDYQLLGAVAVAIFVAFLVNACFAVSVVPRARGAGVGEETVAAINAYRATLGKPAFRYDSRLAAAADFHNRWMRDHGCWAHQCPDEPNPWERIKAAGYSYTRASEVIGRGYWDVASAVAGWRNSPPHNQIITDSYVDAGCAMLEDERSRETWWTCALASGGSPLLPTLTPVPSPTPRQGADPTPTPGPRPALPAGWWMEVTGRFSTFGLPRPATCPSLAGVDCLLTLRVDYDQSDWSVTDWLYTTYCARSDVICIWRRK